MWLIIMLLVLSILNNIVMYYKYKLYNRLPNMSVILNNNENIQIEDIRIYYKKNGDIKKDIGNTLDSLGNKYKSEIVIINNNESSNPANIDKINLLLK